MAGEVLHIDAVELAAGGPPEAKRAYSTLIAGDNEPSRGGLGETRQVSTTMGHVLACKRMLLPERSSFGSKDAYAVEVANRAKAFREEYEALCRLSNFKGFVKVRAYGLLGGSPVILMEWVEGCSVGRIAKQRGPLPTLTVAQIGRDVFHLLARLEWQAELFVHRDLSPENIMVRTSEYTLEQQLSSGYFDICLIDFGSAATLRSGDGAFTTDTRILRGATPAYAAPEMLTSDVPGLTDLRKSSKIDVYAACSVLYELLCGMPPYDLGFGTMGSDYLQKMTHDPLPSRFAAGSPESVLYQTIVQGIRPLQNDRPSAYAVYKALSQYCDDYDDIVEMAKEGIAYEPFDTVSVDHPDLSNEQIALSNPLSHHMRSNDVARPAPKGGGAAATPAMHSPSAAKFDNGRKKRLHRVGIAGAAIAVAVTLVALFAIPALPIGAKGGDSLVESRNSDSRSASPVSGAFDNPVSENPAPVGETQGDGIAAVGEDPDSNAWLMGTWEGAMVSTSDNPSCFGAGQSDMALAVSSVDNGMVTCDVRVVYHGHNRKSQTGNATSSVGDTVQEWNTVKAPLNGGSFTLEIDEATLMGRDSYLLVACVAHEGDEVIDVKATSCFKGAKTVDEYALTQ